MFLHRAFFWLISATNGTAHLKAEKMERLPLVSHKLEFLQGEVDLFPSAEDSASIKRHSNHCWLKGGGKKCAKKVSAENVSKSIFHSKLESRSLNLCCARPFDLTYRPICVATI
jgi:hypothetical protein